MSAIKLLTVFFLLCVGFNMTEAQAKQKNDQVEVYYFYATKRCETCEAVEAVTKEALKEYYGDKIELKMINRDEDKNKPLIEKYQVAWQTLLVLKANKKVDLTSIAFMNARTKPWKLKAKIKETIDKM